VFSIATPAPVVKGIVSDSACGRILIRAGQSRRQSRRPLRPRAPPSPRASTPPRHTRTPTTTTNDVLRRLRERPRPVPHREPAAGHLLPRAVGPRRARWRRHRRQRAGPARRVGEGPARRPGLRRGARPRRRGAQRVHGADADRVARDALPRPRAPRRGLGARGRGERVPRGAARVRHAPARGRRRLHGLLLVEGTRDERRHDVPRRGRRAPAQLAPHAHRLPRPRVVRRALGHARDAAQRPAPGRQGRRVQGRGARRLPAPRLRARGGLLRRRPAERARRAPRRRGGVGAHLRLRALQRLVRARRPEIRVRARAGKG